MKMKRWDPEAYTLTLEYMPNGTLESYLRSHFEQIPPSLHANGIIHCGIPGEQLPSLLVGLHGATLPCLPDQCPVTISGG